jgi:hypothetical protein
MSQLGTLVPGDEVIDWLRDRGATRTDADETFPGPGRHHNLIIEYVTLMQAGEWWESRRPIRLDAKTGYVWQGSDRTAAIAQVDWDMVKANGLPVPVFNIIVQHPKTA